MTTFLTSLVIAIGLFGAGFMLLCALEGLSRTPVVRRLMLRLVDAIEKSVN